MQKVIKFADVYLREKTKTVKEDLTYFKQLDAILDELFEIANERGLSWSDIAKESGLSHQTVVNLGERWTKRPQYRTVLFIANALGMNIQLSAKKGRQRASLRIAS